VWKQKREKNLLSLSLSQKKPSAAPFSNFTFISILLKVCRERLDWIESVLRKIMEMDTASLSGFQINVSSSKHNSQTLSHFALDTRKTLKCLHITLFALSANPIAKINRTQELIYLMINTTHSNKTVKQMETAETGFLERGEKRK
jgi:hypothetical protein